MEIKKYISLENLSLFLDSLKALFATKTEVDAKANSDHNHDDDYDAKGSADTALASAQAYADSAVSAVKDDLLNGAGEAYDTLKELGELIDENVDAISALETIASSKADADHNHNDVYYTESEIDEQVSLLGARIEECNETSISSAKSYTDSQVNILEASIDKCESMILAFTEATAEDIDSLFA